MLNIWTRLRIIIKIRSPRDVLSKYSGFYAMIPLGWGFSWGAIGLH